MGPVFALVAGGICLLVVYHLHQKVETAKREKWIHTYQFPDALGRKVQEQYPHLTDEQAGLAVQGLREYFHVCNLAGRRMVAMPSQVVDVAWHQFILYTRRYDAFCKQGLGRFLHHTPAEAMETPTQAQAGIKTAWRVSCHREGIEPRSPSKLPLLFGIDAALNIPDGFRYSLDCSKAVDQGYCAGHIGCGSGCAGGCGGDSSGCGGGCGGD